MATTLRQAGTCYIKVNGVQLQVMGNVEVPLNTTQREAMVSTQGVIGYKETERAAFVTVEAAFTKDFPVEEIAKNDDMTVTAELANGMTYVLSNAWLEGEANVNPSDGTVTLTFNGLKGGFY